MNKTNFKKERKRILALFDRSTISQSTQQKIRKKSENDFFFFFKTYLSHYASQRFADFQKEIINLITSSTKFIAIAAPRGFSKSTLVSFAYVIWCIVFKKFHFIVIISATDDLADDLSSFIKMEFSDNPLILRDFGNLIKINGSKGDFVINKTRILARGRKQANRGFRYRQHRPDLIIIDDIEKDEEAISLDSVEKTLDIIYRAIVPSLKPNGKLIAIGTILRHNSAFAKLLSNNPEYWDSKIFKALIQKGCNEQSIWEERFSTSFLINQREILGISAFNAEYQNTPTDDQYQIFKQNMLQEGSINPCLTVAFIDPSIEGVKNGDFKVCVFVRGSTEKIEIIDIIASKGSDKDFFKDIISCFQKYQDYLVSIGIESNGFQKYFIKDLHRFSEELHIHLPIKPIKNYIKKEYRIHKLLSWFEQEKIVINPRLIQSKEGDLLTEQLLYFPNKKIHDDIPDALSSAIELLISMEEYHQQSTKSQSNPITHVPSSKKTAFKKNLF
ncbi:MAG: hypothetical protein ACRCV0_00855 [Brevinema sp.]